MCVYVCVCARARAGGRLQVEWHGNKPIYRKTVLSFKDVCLEVKYRDKFGVLQSVVSDCSSNFVEYDSLKRNTDFSCPGTTEHIYNGSLGEYTCSNADRCGQEIGM